MSMLLNRETFKLAFEAWENDYRAHPETFYTAEEVAAMDVADLSEAQAIHMIALLRAQTAGPQEAK